MRNEPLSPQSLRVRLLTSWKLWLLMLFVSLSLIAVAIAIPAYRRLKAFEYVSQHLDYEMEGDDEWITDWFGERAMGLRNVRRISTKDGWILTEELTKSDIQRIACFGELRVLESKMPDMGGFEEFTVEDVRPLTNLTRLEELTLEGWCYSDTALAEMLSAHPPLVSVRLESDQLGSAMLRELSQIPSLANLNLFSQEFDDRDFRGLQPLPNLQFVSFGGSPVGDECVAWLAQSPTLIEISLSGSRITDESLYHLSSLKHLRRLTLYHCEDITSTGIAHLASLPELRILGLPLDVLTPQTIEHLRQYPRLETLFIDKRIDDPELLNVLADEWDITDGMSL